MTLRTAKLLALNEQAPLETSSDIVAPASTERKKEHPAPCVGKGNCIGLEHFNFLAILGKDNFGKVMLAETKTTKQLYAIRVLKKELAIRINEVESIYSEKGVLKPCKTNSAVSCTRSQSLNSAATIPSSHCMRKSLVNGKRPWNSSFAHQES